MQAVELAAPARPIVEAALAQGVMLNCVQGNVLRFLPPLIIDRSHVDQAMDLLAILLEVPHFADADRLLATATK